MEYDIKQVYDHYEIFINGCFYCSEDTYADAVREIKEFNFS
jgi:hypothetical protein